MSGFRILCFLAMTGGPLFSAENEVTQPESNSVSKSAAVGVAAKDSVLSSIEQLFKSAPVVTGLQSPVSMTAELSMYPADTARMVGNDIISYDVCFDEKGNVWFHRYGGIAGRSDWAGPFVSQRPVNEVKEKRVASPAK